MELTKEENINRLTHFIFPSLHEQLGNCDICSKKMDPDNTVCLSPYKCKHTFHWDCVNTYPSCPKCNEPKIKFWTLN